MLLHDLILRHPPAAAEQAALLHGDTTLSYAELGALVERLARQLVRNGLGAGDRVAIYMNKRVETVVAYFATSAAGGVFVPVNPALKSDQVEHVVRDCGARFVIALGSFEGIWDRWSDDARAGVQLILVDGKREPSESGSEVLHWDDVMADSDPDVDLHRRIDNDVASILYTSGSTGKPKGVVLSHRNMVNGAVSVASYIGNVADDRVLAALPFSFDAGLSQLTTAFHAGASVVLLDYLLPRDVVRTIEKFGVTGLTGVPPMWNQLARLDWPEAAGQGIRYFANTGGAMPTATLTLLRERMPNASPFLMYGLTEAFRSTYLPPSEVDRRPTSIGKAIPDAEILVLRDDGTICDANEPGELVHRGALVAQGYWKDPERTAERFRPLPDNLSQAPIPEMAVWSGDTVMRDEEGFLYFVGRKDDMIKSSGYRISPTEVEEAIYATGLVDQCAAIGVPHPMIGQAVLVVAQGASPGDESTEAIAKHCRSRLPNFMAPAEIIWTDEMPKNPNGKIDRKTLSQLHKDRFQ